jgi:hypothetical protein
VRRVYVALWVGVAGLLVGGVAAAVDVGTDSAPVSPAAAGVPGAAGTSVSPAEAAAMVAAASAAASTPSATAGGPAPGVAAKSAATPAAGGGQAPASAPAPPSAPPVAAAGSPAPPPSSASSDYAVDVRMPPCVAKGDTMPVELRTEPESDYGLIIAFSDQGAYETYEVGTTDAAGFHKANFLIKAEVPTGPARLLVSVGRNGRGRTAEFPFTVLAAGAKCP